MALSFPLLLLSPILSLSISSCTCLFKGPIVTITCLHVLPALSLSHISLLVEKAFGLKCEIDFHCKQDMYHEKLMRLMISRRITLPTSASPPCSAAQAVSSMLAADMDHSLLAPLQSALLHGLCST